MKIWHKTFQNTTAIGYDYRTFCNLSEKKLVIMYQNSLRIFRKILETIIKEH